MPDKIALLVDGDNISVRHAACILKITEPLGRVDIARVYGNARTSDWHDAEGFRFIHSGIGKNATDLLLAIDAMELALMSGVDTFVLASSDRDFIHLALRLKERGLTVIGIGEGKTTESYRAACTKFEEVGDAAPKKSNEAQAPVQLVASEKRQPDRSEALPDSSSAIAEVLLAHDPESKGLPLSQFGHFMKKDHGVTRKGWYAYLKKYPRLYNLGPAGSGSWVKLSSSLVSSEPRS